jgi:hypothetical protein
MSAAKLGVAMPPGVMIPLIRVSSKKYLLFSVCVITGCEHKPFDLRYDLLKHKKKGLKNDK